MSNVPTDQDYLLAKVMVDHSVKIKAQEKVLIATDELGLPLAKAAYEEVLKRGAYPIIDINPNGAGYAFYSLADSWQLGYVPDEVIRAKYEWADAFIRIVADENLRELASIDPTKLTGRAKLVRPYSHIMLKKRWILTYYPTGAMAQEARMSLAEMRKFYFDSCLVDYKAMYKRLKKLEKVMDQGEMVHVVGNKTDLWVNIKGRLAQECSATCNIPDGECFLAPVTNGVNGEVYFELPTLAYGHEVSGIHLEFKDGKVINAKAERGDEALQKMLETDEGARYLGEFAIGANFNITRGMLNTLFDEKIGGTIHMALGMAYKDKRGGGENESAIHWDLVKDMRLPGSVLMIDGKEVLKEGKLLV
jgi:aminopeptidase